MEELVGYEADGDRRYQAGYLERHGHRGGEREAAGGEALARFSSSCTAWQSTTAKGSHEEESPMPTAIALDTSSPPTTTRREPNRSADIPHKN